MARLKFNQVLPWAVLSIGLIATYALRQAALHDAHELQRKNFEYQAREIALRIEQRLETYEEVLHGLKGLYAASQSVERNEFKDYAENLHLSSLYPGIQGVGFSLIVQPQQLQQHIAAIKKEGFPDYLPYPPGPRDLYTSIIYLEPFSGRNLRAFGYDMLSEPVRRAAMERARDLNKVELSGKVKLVQEMDQKTQSGVLMYLPIYRNGFPHETLAERRAHIVGWIYAPFRMDDLMEGILGGNIRHIDYEIYDGVKPTHETLLYDADDHLSLHEDTALYHVTQPLRIADRTWTIALRSLPVFEAGIDRSRAALINVTGIAMSVLLALLVSQLVGGRARALRLARNMTHELRESEAALRESQSIAGLGNYVLNLQSGNWQSSEVLDRLLGIDDGYPRTVEGWQDLIHPDDRELVENYLNNQLIEKRREFDKEYRIIRAGDQAVRWVHSLAKLEFDDQGRATLMNGTIQDITETRMASERIENLAHFDQLTGLPNRNSLLDRFKYALSLAQRNGAPLAVMFLDLDNFKNINDTLGHSIGDQLLMETARRMKRALREEDTVSRMGGDEFVFIIPGTDATGAAKVASKLIDAVSQPWKFEQHELTATPSIGIAIYPDDGDSFETLLKNADTAMYRVKQSGRNSYCLFTQEMQAHSARILQLSNALRHALERNELRVLYQPQLSIESGRLIGTEALLRWTHPTLGEISPSEFIPIAEDNGQITRIGEWVVHSAAKQLKDWMDKGLPPMVMAVNMSAVQFHQSGIVDAVTRILHEVQLPHQYLELELTEAVAMGDPQAAIAVMNNLYERGIRMSIDDFGTGYSSLSYLKKFRVYKLKIDQSFVRDISDDPDDKAIVAAIINMARSLGIQTIAEGVETDSQLAFLRLHGCNEVQGYYFSKPLTADQFEAFARKIPSAVQEQRQI